MTVFLDTLGIGLLIPIFPQIMNRFSTDHQDITIHFGIFIGVYALAQFIASPVLGAISDRFGRKIVLLCSLMGATLDYFFMAYAPTFTLLIIARVISGLTGASMTVATAYVVDISEEKDRTTRFGYIGAAWGLGFIAGPAIGAILAQGGVIIPFWVAAILNLFNFIFGIFVLPESLSLDKRRAITIKAFNPFKSLIKTLSVPKVSLYVWVYFFIFLAGQSLAVNWYLYTEEKFHWSSLEIGISLSFIGIIVALSQGLLTRILIPKLGETKAVTFGLVFYVLSFFLFSVVTQSWMMYAVILLFGLTGVATPSLHSLASKFTPDQEQGELHGSIVSLENLAAVLAPALFTPLYSYFSSSTGIIYFPGIVFLVSSLLYLLTLLFWTSIKSKAHI